MNLLRLSRFALVICLCTFLFAYSALAQPPGRGGFDPRQMIDQMDANGNGTLEPEEISDRARGFLLPRLKEAGIDTSKPIPLTKVHESFQKMREDREREYGRGRDRDREPEVITKAPSGLVLDFNSDSTEGIPLVPDFSLPDDSPLLQSGKLEDRYSREVMERADRTLREYDRNRNGSLEGDELRNGRWSPPAHESDLDKDGKLTRIELAERYKAKYSGSSDDRRGDSGSRSDQSGRQVEESRERSADRQRETTTSSSSRSSSSRSSSSPDSKNARIQEYALSMMKKYDSNKNGKLEENEYKTMRGKPESGDKDGDKTITMDELIVLFGGTPGKVQSSRSGPVTARIGAGNRVPTLEERLAEQGVSSKFISQDTSKDGNLQMSEFSKLWDDRKLEEFDKLDVNGDGVISPTEWMNNGG